MRQGQLGDQSTDLQARKKTDFPNDVLCCGPQHFSLKGNQIANCCVSETGRKIIKTVRSNIITLL